MKFAPSLHLAQPKQPCWHGLCRKWSPTSCAHEVPEPSFWAQPLDAWASVLGSVSVFSFSQILLPGDCFTCCHWNEHKRRMYDFMIPIFYLSKSNESILRKNCQLRRCDLFGFSQCMNLIRTWKRRCPFLACARAPVVQWPSWWQLMAPQLSSENAMWQTKELLAPTTSHTDPWQLPFNPLLGPWKLLAFSHLLGISSPETLCRFTGWVCSAEFRWAWSRLQDSI